MAWLASRPRPGPVAVGDVAENDGAVEHVPGLNPTFDCVAEWTADVPSGGGNVTGEGDVAHEHVEVHRYVAVLGCDDPADRATTASHGEGGFDGCFEADPFEHGLSPVPSGELPDPLDILDAALGDVSDPEPLAEAGALLVAAHQKAAGRPADRTVRWSAPAPLTLPTSRRGARLRGPVTGPAVQALGAGVGPRGGPHPSRTPTRATRGAKESEGGDVGRGDPAREPQPLLDQLGRAEVLSPDQ